MPVNCDGPIYTTISKAQVATGTLKTQVTAPHDTLSFELQINPLSGIATVDKTTGVWTYTPNVNFIGEDTFVIHSIATGPGASKVRCSTDIYISVVAVDLTITKSAKKLYVESTDTLTYTIDVTNTGSVSIDTSVVKDILPANTTIAPNTTYINEVLVPEANIVSGITINSLAVGATKTINFTVNVNDATPGQILSNIVNYTAESTISGTKINKTGSSNTFNTPVLKFNFTKTVDKTLVLQGDTLTYTITLTNTSGFDLTSAIIKDTIPALTTLVPNSTKVNTELAPLANIVSGIEVGPLAPNQSVKVSFDVRLIDTATVGSTINNTASLTFIANINESSLTSVISSNATSSTVSLSNAVLNILESVFPSQANVGDSISYTLIIKNLGSLVAKDIILTNILAEQLQYANNLTVNGEILFENITTGANIGSINPGASVIVTFNAIVVSLPLSTNISTVTTGSFSYILPSGTVLNGNSNSNVATVKVFEANATMSKVSNKSIVNVSDTFVYTITIKNTGNIATTDYILTDTLPAQFNVQQIIVNGQIVLGNLETGISLGVIKPGEIVIVKVKILVVSEFSSNIEYKNVVLGNLKYTVNGVPSSKNISATDLVGVKIIQPNLRLQKSSDLDIAIVNDIITYTIVATNHGNLDFINVVITDLLPSGLDFVEKSVTINGVIVPLANILSGVRLGAIKSSDAVTLEFKAMVISDSNKNICSIASADYYYSMDNGKSVEYGMVQSNSTCIAIEKSNLIVTKTADKDEVLLNDVITYKVTVKNESNSVIDSVVFKDALSSSLKLVDDSIIVNEVVVTNPNLTLGVNIGTIAPKEVIAIQFKAIVIAGGCNGTIINEAYVQYKYVMSNGVVRFKISNIAIIEICSKISAFKQLSIDRVCPIPVQKPDMEEVNDIFVDAKILNSYVINTYQGISNSGQNLSGYKLVVNGVLNIIIEYTASLCSQSIHSYTCEVPFGTFIILPINYSIGQKINVEVKIEDVDYEQINCREVFTNIMYLVIATIN